jgi:hypothetical protein
MEFVCLYIYILIFIFLSQFQYNKTCLKWNMYSVEVALCWKFSDTETIRRTQTFPCNEKMLLTMKTKRKFNRWCARLVIVFCQCHFVSDASLNLYEQKHFCHKWEIIKPGCLENMDMILQWAI